jgi:sulfatase modifying factor 1
MSDNVMEWCQGWWGGDYSPEPVTDPTGSATGPGRVIRGGSWFNGAVYGRAAHRGELDPGLRNYIIGFRLVLPGQQ